MKASIFTTFAAFLVSVLVALFKGTGLTGFVDALFVIGMLLLTYSGLQLMKELGAFRVITYSFKRVSSKLKLSFLFGTNKNLEVSEHMEDEPKEVRIEDYLDVEKRDYTVPLFISSLTMVIFSIVFSFVFLI